MSRILNIVRITSLQKGGDMKEAGQPRSQGLSSSCPLGLGRRSTYSRGREEERPWERGWSLGTRLITRLTKANSVTRLLRRF